MISLPTLEMLHKYNTPGGRYAVFPPHKDWKQDFDQSIWLEQAAQIIEEGRIDLYVHVPFCERLCTFCGCNISVTKDQEQGRFYVQALLKEWQQLYRNLGNPQVQNIYLGGGTPTFLAAENLDLLLRELNLTQEDQAWRVIEVDPRFFDINQAKVLKDHGFTTASLGIQDFNDLVTSNVNRAQSFEQILQTVEICRSHGMAQIGIDLIYGLPLQSRESIGDWEKFLAELLPEQIAFYPLARVPWLEKSQRAFGQYELPSTTEKFQIYLTALKVFERFDFSHLGMGHFAKKGSALHQAYETETLRRNVMGFSPQRNPLWVGLGVGSISGALTGFTQNTKILDQYLTAIDQARLPLERGVLCTALERGLNQLFEQLICQHKVDKKVTEQNITADQLKDWTDEGFIVSNSSEYMITQLGTHFLKNICKAFL